MANEAQLAIHLPQEMRNGTYANMLQVWHTPDDFTLDFICTGMAHADGDGKITVPAEVIARVKVPVSVIFKIAQAIATNVDRYEKQFGPITPRPADVPLFPPSEGEEDEPDQDNE